MEEIKKRDFYIDTVRGLCVFAIIFVHTVFWSGLDYVPISVRNFALFFDIPAFFFITGCTIKISMSVNPVKQMAKLLILFAVLFIVLQFFSFFSVLDFVSPLLFKDISLSLFPVFTASYWFVPVYIICLLYAAIVINYLKKYFLLLFLLGIPLIYLTCWCTDTVLVNNVLGLQLQQLLFYFWLILLGFQLYDKSKKTKFISGFILIILSLGGVWLLRAFSVDMQIYKFPVVKLPYFVISLLSVGLILILAREVKENFVSKVGKNAIYYYASQGISSSLVVLVAKNIQCNWWCKLLVCYALNCVIALILGYLIYIIFRKAGNYIFSSDGKLW